MIEPRCISCRKPYPSGGVPYRCPECGGLFSYSKPPAFDHSQIDDGAPGIWRYRSTFGLPDNSPQLTIGEGNTPLVFRRVSGREIAFKLEFVNPTGSFKDRGSPVLLSFLRSRGVAGAVEDSSGNAGASLAAYAAAAGMAVEIFVPDSASGPKLRQMEIHGAKVVRVAGGRSKASEAALEAVKQGAVYASHAYLPFGLLGYATLAYELFAQLGEAPGTLILPAGQGGLYLGVWRGFESLKKANLIARMPAVIGVQAQVCAPLWNSYQAGGAEVRRVDEGYTLAEGIRVPHPVRIDELLEVIVRSDGKIVAVDETQIIPGRQALASLGFYVEPTSAVVWDALKQLSDSLVDPVAVILTGSGLKSP